MTTMLITTKGADNTVKFTIRDLEFIINSVKEDNFDMKKGVSILEKYMEINECENCMFFEITKRMGRLWITNNKLSFRFTIVDFQSIFDLSFPVNYYKNGGHILLFDKSFDEIEHLKELKNVLNDVFKSKTDNIERVTVFYYLDNQICFRNYLLNDLSEIGPRIDLKLERIFEGCFKGQRIYSQPENEVDENNTN